MREITVDEVKAMYPHLNTADVKAAVHLPLDGQCDPANIAMALAKGARQNGATVLEGVKVTSVLSRDGRVTGRHLASRTAKVLRSRPKMSSTPPACGGARSPTCRATLPLHACEHFYIVTEPIANLQRLPVLRVPDECTYYKEDAGKMLIGAFELKAKPWGMDGISDDFCFDQLPEDFDHFQPILENAINRMPMLETAGIHTFFNGPESFTPDDRYYLGEVPQLKGYWVAAGYNSIGIVSSGGAGIFDTVEKFRSDGFFEQFKLFL